MYQKSVITLKCCIIKNAQKMRSALNIKAECADRDSNSQLCYTIHVR